MVSKALVLSGPMFKRELKPLVKKFKSLFDEIEDLIQQLTANPKLGTPLGKSCYKIRLAVRSKGGSKSGGMRIITYVVVQLRPAVDGVTTVYLASIYDKSERETLDDTRLQRLVADITSSSLPNS